MPGCVKGFADVMHTVRCAARGPHHHILRKAADMSVACDVPVLPRRRTHMAILCAVMCDAVHDTVDDRTGLFTKKFLGIVYGACGTVGVVA